MNREQFSDESANISEAFEFLIPMKFGFSQTKVGSVFQYKEVLTRPVFKKRKVNWKHNYSLVNMPRIRVGVGGDLPKTRVGGEAVVLLV